jgi:multidrug efflux system membrane fusion protein
MKRFSMAALFAVIAAIAGGGYWYWQKAEKEATEKNKAAVAQGKDGNTGKAVKDGKGKGKGKGRGGPVAVRMVSAKTQPMPVVIDAVGTVESEHSVAVRPQVGGTLTAVMFKEGDYVRQGQVLFRIDSRPMQVSVAQTQAAVNRDEAQLAQARAQEQRLRPLADKEYITRQEYDVAATQMKSLEATVAANKAVVEQAQLQLSYSQITAPISGRTGSLSVKAGNLVASGTGGAPLVMINSTRPILVALSVPQRNLDDIRKMGGGKSRLKVELSPPGGGGKVAVGEIVFIDNAVNPQTGTILVKAQVKNEKEELWPGQFVAGRIILRVEDEAVTLPEGAVQPGQEGPFVFVVEEGRARARNVTVDRQLDGLMVISKGLRGDEQVVIDVPPTLTSGSQVVLATDAGGGKGDKGGKGGKGKGDAEAGGAAKGEGDAKAGREAKVDGAKVAPAKEEKAVDAGEAKKDGSKGKKAE